MDDSTLIDYSEQELVAALRWLVNLCHGMSKGGPNCPVTDDEWQEAADTGAAILAKYKEANRAVLPLSR
jgi:hypothetical protein